MCQHSFENNGWQFYSEIIGDLQEQLGAMMVECNKIDFKIV